MKVSKNNISLIYDIVFSILVFSLPLSMAVPNISLAVLFLIFIIKDKTLKSKLFLNAVILLVSFYIFKSFITGTFLINLFFVKHLLTVLVLAVFSLQIKDKKLIKLSFLIGLLIAVIITIFKISTYYYHYAILPLGDTLQSKELLLIERPYFGFMSVIGIIISIQLKADNNRFKSFFLINIILLILFIVLISARLSLALVFIIFVTSILVNKKLNIKKTISYFILLALSLAMLFLTNDNLKNRFHIQSTFEKTVKTFSNHEPRFIIWNCVSDLIFNKDYSFIFGYNNISNTRNKLVTCYSKKIENESKKAYYLKERFNSHNQFLDFLLSGGIIGLLLFSLCFLSIIYYQKYNVYTFLIILAFVLFCFVENILWRQWGAYLFGIFIPLFEFTPIKKNEK